MDIYLEALMHIFERFYKADQSRNCHSGGNGLGLYILNKRVVLTEADLETGAVGFSGFRQ